MDACRVVPCAPSPVSVRIEAVISHGDLALVWNMGGRPGDEIQIIHPLYLCRAFPIPIANLTLVLQEGESLQGKQRTDHVFKVRFFIELVRVFA